MKLNLKALLCVIIMGRVESQVESDINCNLSPISNCPLHSFESDIVTPQDMIDQNAMRVPWLQIYYSQFDPHQSYGKCNARWNAPDKEGIVHRELMCYNFDKKRCESFANRVTWKSDTCGRLEEIEVNATMDAKFYSQNISQYLWYDSCYDQKDSGGCGGRYLDLLVRDNRNPDGPIKELDFQDLPWHLISADLKNNFDMEFSDILMKFAWKGPECGFDGETSSGLQLRTNYIWLMYILLLTFIF